MNLDALDYNNLIKHLAEHPHDNQAWLVLIKRCEALLYATLKRECGKRGKLSAAVTLDDLAQEVYRKVYITLDRFKGKYQHSFEKFLCIIALNTVKNQYRQQRAKGRPPEEKRLSLEDVRTDEESHRPLRLLEVLPDPDWWEKMNLEDLLQDIQYCLDAALRRTRHKTRDELIFHFHFVRDIRIEQIAALPEIRLSKQRVFGVRNGLKKKINLCLEKMGHEN